MVRDLNAWDVRVIATRVRESGKAGAENHWKLPAEVEE